MQTVRLYLVRNVLALHKIAYFLKIIFLQFTTLLPLSISKHIFLCSQKTVKLSAKNGCFEKLALELQENFSIF